MPSYVRPEGPAPARLMAVGEAPGAEEEAQGRPFCGAAGHQLTGQLREVGIPRNDVFISNVLRYRPPGNQIRLYVDDYRKSKPCPSGFMPWSPTPGIPLKWVVPFVPEHVEHLKQEILAVNPNLILAFGNVALWALTGEEGIMKWAGSEMECKLVRRPDGRPFKVMPILHPAYILRQYADRYITIRHLRRAASEMQTPTLYVPPYNFTVRPTFRDTIDFLTWLKSQLDQKPVKFTVDLETRAGHIACCGIGLSRFVAFCIPFMAVSRPQGYWASFEEEFAVVKLLREVLIHPNALIVGQNFNYDRKFMALHWLVIPRTYMDTMVVHHTCYPGLEKALDFQSSLYCDHHTYWKDESKEWDPHIGEDQLWIYNCKDCAVDYEVSDVLENVVPRLNLRRQADEQMAVNHVAFKMMLRGVRRRPDLAAQFKQEVEKEIAVREEFYRKVLGHDLNPRSAPQMQALFYGDFKLKPVINRKTDRPTLDDAALQILAKRQPLIAPLVDNISEHRSLGVFKSTFIDAEIDPDERIRTYLNTAGAETFRWTSSESKYCPAHMGKGANLQNIPLGGKNKIALYCREHGPTSVGKLCEIFGRTPEEMMGDLDRAEDEGAVKLEYRAQEILVHYRLQLPNIRQLFAPDPGYVITEWDLDRADLQVVVWEAGDKELKQALREGADIHSLNAKDLLCSRDMAKRFVHLIDYGGSARTASAKCGITVHTAETMQRRWFEAHPGIKAWHRRTQETLLARKPIVNKFGYARFYFDRPEEVLPEALAWTPQSTVGLVIVKALLQFDANLPEAELLLQVHDSILLQTRIENCPEIFPKMQEQMLVTIPYDDPLVIPASGKYSPISWGDAKEVEMPVPAAT